YDGKLVCKFSELKLGGSAAIDFSNDCRRRRIADVIEPGFDGNFGGGLGEIAEAKEIGVGGGIHPNGWFQFGGHGGGLRGIKTGACKFKDAAVFEIVANDLGKKGGVGLGGIRTSCQIRDVDEGLCFTEPGGNSDAVLGRSRVCYEQDSRDEEQRPRKVPKI